MRIDQAVEDYRGRLPSDVIPIGDDPYGNLICLGVRGGNRGAVYFWDHEDELDEEGLSKLDYGNMYKLADGFEEFVDKLKAE